MAKIEICASSKTYPVYIGSGLLADSESFLAHLPGTQCLIVTNETVAPIYLETVRQSLAGLEVSELVLPDGEQFKTADSWLAIHDQLIRMKASRDTALVALGGGVIGDLAGFAAATYMRGIDLIQVPTTLLAQVDASVGGKTAVNHAAGKNLIGAFYQPTAVVIDTATLDTLDEREYCSGLAETVKYGAIGDPGFFAWLEQHSASILERDPEFLSQLISSCVRHKAAVVAEDEFEHGSRALLNFGHTFAHAIETLTGYGVFLHGEAVSIGMVMAARLSEDRKLCAPGAAERLQTLLHTFQLPVTAPAGLSAAAMIDTMKIDKKSVSGAMRFILLREIGAATVVTDITEDHLLALLS
jgi:3-dehydroquinate synthase